MRVICKTCETEKEIPDESEYGLSFRLTRCDACENEIRIPSSERVRMNWDWWEWLWIDVIKKIKAEHSEDLAKELVSFMSERKWRDHNHQFQSSKPKVIE